MRRSGVDSPRRLVPAGPDLIEDLPEAVDSAMASTDPVGAGQGGYAVASVCMRRSLLSAIKLFPQLLIRNVPWVMTYE